MLMYGGALLVSSIEEYREPRLDLDAPTEAMTPAEEEISRALVGVDVRVASAHARSIRHNALASLPVALLMLFAAAATMSRDRRGRNIALAAAWTSIVYQVTTLPFIVPLMRDYALQAAPLRVRQFALHHTAADAATFTPELVTNLFTALPVLGAAFGIAGSLVLIRYFGGRRGRVLYGLEGRRP
jgi:hypothetical protein